MYALDLIGPICRPQYFYMPKMPLALHFLLITDAWALPVIFFLWLFAITNVFFLWLSTIGTTVDASGG